MDNNVLFGNTMEAAAKALDLRSRKHDLIVSNLANADTPGYKAFDLMVAESIQKQEGAKSKVQITRTNPVHLPSARGAGAGVAPKIIRVPEQDNLRGDGNTVDMDREMASLAANQLLYKASAQIMSKKFQGLKSVITGGR